MSQIKIDCIGQVLNFENMPVISAGDKNVDTVKFTFSKEWSGFAKIAVFFQQKSELAYSMIDNEGLCNIPNSIMALSGKIYIGVYGINSLNQVLTSGLAVYTIEDGIVNAGSGLDFPGDEAEAQEFYNKILSMCSAMQTAHSDALNNMAYVRVKGANEFEYDESKLEKKIKDLAYTKHEVDEDIESNMNELKNSLESTKTELDDKIRKLSNRLYQVEVTPKNINSDGMSTVTINGLSKNDLILNVSTSANSYWVKDTIGKLEFVIITDNTLSFSFNTDVIISSTNTTTYYVTIYRMGGAL